MTKENLPPKVVYSSQYGFLLLCSNPNSPELKIHIKMWLKIPLSTTLWCKWMEDTVPIQATFAVQFKVISKDIRNKLRKLVVWVFSEILSNSLNSPLYVSRALK